MKRTAGLFVFLAMVGLSGVWALPDAAAQNGGGQGRAARVMARQSRGRVFTAVGPSGEADLARLREALAKVPEIGMMQVGPVATGAAVRLSGQAALADLVAAGKTAGYTLHRIAGYVVAGPNGASDLARLRGALEKAPGVEAVESRALSGGATLLVYGEAAQPDLVGAAKAVGYTLFSINDGGVREFRMGNATPESQQKLVEAVKLIMGVEGAEVRATPDGPRLVLTGGRLRPEPILAAASAAGITLTMLDALALPSLEPRAGRDTRPTSTSG